MAIITQWRRMVHRSAIAPFAWEAYYRDGTVVKQFDPFGVVFIRDVDRQRLEKLRILGHAYSPLDLPVPFDQRIRPLDEIICKTSVDMHLPGPGRARLSHTVRWFFGYRYGTELFLLEIDEYGRLYRTNTDRGQGTGANDMILHGGLLL